MLKAVSDSWRAMVLGAIPYITHEREADNCGRMFTHEPEADNCGRMFTHEREEYKCRRMFTHETESD